MKAKLIPTSPKNRPTAEPDDVEAFLREPEGITKPTIIRFSTKFLVLVVGLSLFAGAVGTIVILYGQDQWAWLARWTGTTTVEQPVARTVTRKTDPAPTVSEAVKTAAQNVVGIYVRRVSVGNTAPILEQLYLPSDRRGAGVLLTEDGVGVTTRRAIPDLNKEIAVVSQDKTVYLTKQFFVDPASDLVYFQISARGLPVVDFAQLDGLTLGETLLDVSRQATSLAPLVGLTSLTTNLYHRVDTRNDLVRSSDTLPGLVQSKVTVEVPGVPTFTTDSKLVGVHTGNDGDLIPVSTLQSGLERLQKTGEVSRNVLGVRYLDLTEAKGLLLKPTTAGEAGALLTSDATNAAVRAKSPADRAGLKTGDLILKVNGAVLTATFTLSDAIQQLPARAVTTLTFRRDGKEQSVPVTLDVTTP